MFKEMIWVVIYRSVVPPRSFLSQDRGPLFAVIVTGIKTYLFLLFSEKNDNACEYFLALHAVNSDLLSYTLGIILKHEAGRLYN